MDRQYQLWPTQPEPPAQLELELPRPSPEPDADARIDPYKNGGE